MTFFFVKNVFFLELRMYEGHPESKDRSAVKKNKQNKHTMNHYCRP